MVTRSASRNLICGTTLLLASLCCAKKAFAQCGFDALHQHMLSTDSAYAKSVREVNEAWVEHQMAAAQQKMVVSGTDTVVEIPIVFHVLHNGEPIGSLLNPSDSQLISLVNYVDAAFNAQWPAYPTTSNGGVRTRIRFRLAKTDPNCKSTSAILRVNASSVPYYSLDGVQYPGSGGPGAPELSLKTLSWWPGTEYLNVWIVNKISKSGIAGYAYSASPALSAGYGVVMLASTAIAGTSTLVHEIGHCFGLAHTFEGNNGGTTCPPLNNCASTGDLICDTEPCHAYPSCAAGAINACTGAPFAGVQHNFMNYTSCPDRFTPGQRDKMLFTLEYFINTLKNSLQADSVKPFVPVTGPLCSPTKGLDFDSTRAIAGPSLVSFKDIYRVSLGCREDGGKVLADNTCRYRTLVVAGRTYPLTVGVTGVTQDVRAYIDFNNDGAFQVPAELVLSRDTLSPNRNVVAYIVIPKTGVVLNKPLRMRVVADARDAGASFIGPCAPMYMGQAEDYAVTIVTSESVSTVLNIASIHPNPASDFVNISFRSPINGYVSLLDVLGRRVSYVKLAAAITQSIDTRQLPAGIYSIAVKPESGQVTMIKVVIEH